MIYHKNFGVFGILLLIGQALQALNPLNALCWQDPWQVTECQVTTIYEDGQSATTGFVPEKEQNVTASSCYKFGCHPLYCDNWRANLRISCKKEWERQRKLLSKFARATEKKIASESFEACAVLPPATGVLYPIDWLSRKTFSESWFAVCTTDTQDKENAFLSWAKQHGPEIANWFKQTAKTGWGKTKEYAAYAKELFTAPQATPKEKAEALESAKLLHGRTTVKMPFGYYTQQLAENTKEHLPLQPQG